MTSEFSMDGKQIATISQDRTLRLWDTTYAGWVIPGTPFETPKLRIASFSTDRTRLVSKSEDGVIRLWDTTNGTELGEKINHPDASHFVFSGNNLLLATVADGNVRLWNATTGKSVSERALEHSDVSSILFSDDGERIVTASRDGKVNLWDAKRGTLLIDGPLNYGDIRDVKLAKGGERLITRARDGTVYLLDARTGRSVRDRVLQKNVSQIFVVPGGDRVGTLSADEMVRLWDATSGEPVGKVFNHPGVTNIFPDSTGARLATTSKYMSVRIWDSTTGEPVANEPVKHPHVAAGKFTGDDKRLITLSGDGMVRLWDLDEPSLPRMTLDHDRISDVVSSPDSKKLVTWSGSDGTIRVWDVTGSVALLDSEFNHPGVFSVAFEADSSRIATLSIDGTERLWDLRFRRVVASLASNFDPQSKTVQLNC